MFYAYLLPHPISVHACNRVTHFEFSIFIHLFIVVMKGACDLCDSNYFLTISSYYNNKDAALDFLKHHGVIPFSVKSPRYGALCNFFKDRNL